MEAAGHASITANAAANSGFALAIIYRPRKDRAAGDKVHRCSPA
jgi:hypothetical protein